VIVRVEDENQHSVGDVVSKRGGQVSVEPG
jgi:hypothetical protein